VQLVGIDRVDWPEDQPMPAHLQFEKGDYTDLALLDRLLPGCDAIIHTAGPNGEQVATMDMAQFVDLNVTCNVRLLEAAQRTDVKNVVLSSTMEVLTGRDWTPSGAAIVDEDFAPVSDSQYALSRYLMEEMAKQYSRLRGLSVVSLRYMASGYATWDKIGLCLMARHLTGRDVARAVLMAAAKNDFVGDVIHIGPETPLNNQDIINALSDPESVLEKYYPGSVAVLEQAGEAISTDLFWPATTIRKAKRLLDWTPLDTFEKWLTEHGWEEPDA
jgi:nucleoside-diphosphate-sugar epimerase